MVERVLEPFEVDRVEGKLITRDKAAFVFTGVHRPFEIFDQSLAERFVGGRVDGELLDCVSVAYKIAAEEVWLLLPSSSIARLQLTAVSGNVGLSLWKGMH